MDWFRLYDEIINDPKVRRMKSAAKLGVLTTLFCLANKGRPRGTVTIDKGLPWELDEIAERAMASPELVQDTIDYLLDERIGILVFEDGILRFKNWGKRQYDGDTSTERVRKHRMKQKGNVTETFHDCSGNVSVTPPETDSRQQTADPETDLKDSCLTAAGQSPEADQPRPTNSELINELTQAYRAVEGIQEAKGDHAFIGALYAEHGYGQVLSAINKLQMAAAVQELQKPLVYLKGILEPREKGGEKRGREPTDDKKREYIRSLYL